MKPRPQVVNIDGVDPGYYAYERQRIEAAGADFLLRRSETEDEVIAACRDAEVILVERTSRPFTRRMLAALPRCRGLMACGTGYDGFDVAAATELGIVVCNAADCSAEDVADHTAALILAATRRLFGMGAAARSGVFRFPIAGLRRLSALTLGLIGYGRIARAVAQRMAGFGVTILVVVHRPETAPSEPGVTVVTLDRLLRESDIVSIHLPLTAETKGLIGAAALRQMKPTALLVNTGRGLIVDQDALIQALQEKRLGGAALDVMVPEPLPLASPLATLDNVILTPHYGGVSEESEMDLHIRVAESVEAILRGEPPPCPVNPAVRRRSQEMRLPIGN